MRVLFALLVFCCLACTKANPAVCCATQAQCAEIDLEELRPCGAGQACKNHVCVASECDTSAECPVENPICMDNVCVGSCTTDDECVGTGRRFCEAGVCIGCRSPLDCPANAAICDQADLACRGCRADDECTSGVCIEADGVCAAFEQLIYVNQFGTDAGACSASSPCATLNYAFQQVTPSRNVIRVVGGSLPVPSTVATNASVVFDGSGTTIVKPATGPLFQINFGNVTIEGFTIIGPTTMPTAATIALSSGALRVTKTTMSTALIDAANGSVQLEDMTVAAATPSDTTMVKCNAGTLTATRVTFQKAVLESANCALTVRQSVHEGLTDRSIQAFGGLVVIENNLIIESMEFSDSMSVVASAPGSVIRYNTFVNTSGVNGDGVALYCDGTQDVSSNIFAYRSMHPLGSNGGSNCKAHHSLFDSVAVAAERVGVGNRVAEYALIFANANARDFHLAAQSEAKGGGEPGLVDLDLEGAPRPRPVGSNPDMGCFEAP